MKSVLAMSALGVIAVSSCLGCASTLTATVRTSAQQRSHAIQLKARCQFGDVDGDNEADVYEFGGTGVVVSRTELLTAAHVVACELEDVLGNEYKGKLISITGTDTKGVGRPLKVARFAPDEDLARLRIADAGLFDNVAPLRLGKAHEGMRVCIEVAVPNRDRRCGEIEELERGPHGIHASVLAEPGNSGSGMYDSRGRLIGILTQKRFLISSGQTTGSKGTAVGDRSWILEGSA